MKLKFRAWDKEDKEMLEVYGINFDAQGIWTNEMIDDESDGNFVLLDEVELLQYTGLKDKNGIEIYEGDIIKVIEDSIFGGTYLGVIEFIERLGVYGFSMYNTNVLKTREYSKDSIGFNAKMFGNRFTLTEAAHRKNTFDIEVVGNAYENRELMEEW